MARAVALRRWWEQVDEVDGYQRRSRLARTFNDPDTSFSFYGVAGIDGRDVPVMGEVEEMLFDQPKGSNLDGFRRELREFVLRYLMRVSDFRKPTGYVANETPRRSGLLRQLSFCQDDSVAREGFGYAQWYYKRSDNGQVGRFTDEKRYEITDVREIGSTFDWIMLRVRIFDFTFAFKPFGQNFPQLNVPLDESSFLIMSPEFIVDETGPRVLPSGERVIGQYGFGYGFVPDPTVGVLGYGPGEFDVAFQHIHFRVLENGQARVQLVFVANRLQRVANVPLVPINLSFDIANFLSLGLAKPVLQPLRRFAERLPLPPSFDPITALVDFANFATVGQAARQLCISRERLEEIFLVRHFIQHHDMITGALLTWREIRDWTNETTLPQWVKTGVSS
ncbi:MAG TPA: hypothetical protein VMM76_23940 [Pirellulaceae bacterium]|nr:hypothetical protein [Pirellulaceae bacterium]